VFLFSAIPSIPNVILQPKARCQPSDRQRSTFEGSDLYTVSRHVRAQVNRCRGWRSGKVKLNRVKLTLHRPFLRPSIAGIRHRSKPKLPWYPATETSRRLSGLESLESLQPFINFLRRKPNICTVFTILPMSLRLHERTDGNI
jgi:hypothetical protein